MWSTVLTNSTTVGNSHLPNGERRSYHASRKYIKKRDEDESMIVEKTESHNSLPASAPTINRSHGSLKERKIVFREPYQRSRIDKERSENHSTIQPKPTSHKTNMFKPIHIEISSKGYKGNLLHKAMVCALAVIILFYGLMLQHESERSMLNATRKREIDVEFDI